VFPFSLTITFLSRFVFFFVVFFFIFFVLLFLPPFARSAPCEETLETTSHSRAKGLGLFLLKQKRRRGYTAARRPATVSGDHRRPRDEEEGSCSERSEGEDATGGFLPRSISGPASNRYVRPSSFLSSHLFSSFSHLDPSFPLLLLLAPPPSLPRARRSSSLFFYVYGTLGFSSPRTETIEPYCPEGFGIRFSILIPLGQWSSCGISRLIEGA